MAEAKAAGEQKSAYQLLGVSERADDGTIRAAFDRARAAFTPQRLASEPGAAEKLQELQAAYKLLSDPEMRAAHDRKLAGAGASRAPAVVIEEEPSPVIKLVKVGILLLVVGIAAAAFLR